ncbi:Histone acetyltransferase HAC12 [Linum grandiflorum]
MQGLVANHRNMYPEPEVVGARQFIRTKIYEIILQRQPQQVTEQQRQRFIDIAKRLEDGLYTHSSKEEYLNLGTLEARLSILLKRTSINSQNQRHAQLANSSSAAGTMIPTPGMSHSVNSNLMSSSVDPTMTSSSASDSIVPTPVTSASMMPSSAMQGGMSNGYQQSPANFGINSGGNMSSMGMQRMGSQMIPTPGFSSNTNNNQSYINMGSSNSSVGHSTVESAMSQPPQQKQYAGSQHSRILHTLGSQMGNNIRSGLQNKSYGFGNGSSNGGMGMMGNNMQQLLTEPGVSEDYMTDTQYGSSPKPLQQPFDQHDQQFIQGDGYGMNSSDSLPSGSFYGAVSSVASLTNAQNFSGLPSLSKTASAMVNNSSNLHGMPQAALVRSQSAEQSDKAKYPPQLLSRDGLLQSQKQQQYHQNSHEMQQHLFQQQHLQQQQSQRHQYLLNADTSSHPRLHSEIGNQVKHEPGLEIHNELLNTKPSEQIQVLAFQNQFVQNVTEDRSQGVFLAPGREVYTPQQTQNSHQMQQMLHQNDQLADSQTKASSLPVGSQADTLLPGRWHPHSQDWSHMPGSMSHEQHIQEDFRQRISRQDDAQRNNLASEAPIIRQTVAQNTSETRSVGSNTNYRSGNPSRDRQFRNQQRWLLFLRHARRCTAPEGKCPEYNCITVQQLCRHMDKCNSKPCSYPRCQHTRTLLQHQKSCRDAGCPVCIPVKHYMETQFKARRRATLDAGLQKEPNENTDNAPRLIAGVPSVVETSEDLNPSLKRMKIEQSLQSLKPESESSVSAASDAHMTEDVPCQDYKHGDASVPVKAEYMEVKLDPPSSSRQAITNSVEKKLDIMDHVTSQRPNEVSMHVESSDSAKQDRMKVEKEANPVKQENILQPAENGAGTKSGKPKIKGVSLTELFTPEQIREHIAGLRRWVGQSKAKAEKNQAMEHSMSENSCQLCAVEKLTFEPPPIYCTPCGARIKRNAMYYTMGAGETRHFFCIPCYNESRGESIVVDGTSIPKARLEKKKNDEETEEWWVQCDKCEAWQHQICALFNGRRNDGGQAEYTCPNCYVAEIEQGERTPLPQSAVLGAKDLPRTILSDQIEQRLFTKLKQERLERARVQGRSYDEVPGAEALVVRVVSSVDKKLEVKQRFLETFREDNYPLEFPYKSKVVLLFQNIEGVEVCLFGMYLAMLRKAAKENIVVELTNLYDHFFVSGGECKAKVTAARLPYFDGDYWPGAAEDLIYQLNQDEDGRKHNKKGTTKKTITKRALKASGQSDLTGNVSKDLLLMHKVILLLPEHMSPFTFFILHPCMGHSHFPLSMALSSSHANEANVFAQLGETIFPMKEDFIMVHLQYCCSHCCTLMVCGNRWVCNQCKKFQICDSCYEAEQKREERERHPVNHREKHALYPVEINDVTIDTKDQDEILESEFFDTRQAFLSLCQGNHYQYDTLRRAKHSSMMILYHLHNPTAPAFVTTCNKCHLDIETGQGWRCEVCPEFDVCNACYQKDGCVDHPHKLTNHPSIAERDAQNKEARQLRVLQLRKMLDLLVHASLCRWNHCQYLNCRKVKGLFKHGINCKTRASGGCVLCKKMWYLLQLHARACKESQCNVPRCRDLKEHLRRLQQQADSRRRAAVMEMMRQRAAEVNGS